MTNWLECDECHVGCKPHEDWCSHVTELRECLAVSARRRYVWEPCGTCEWCQENLPPHNVAPSPPPERGHSTVPGRMTFTVLERK